MKIEIQRKWYTEKSSIGKLLLDGAFLCYTLEDKMREPLPPPGAPIVDITWEETPEERSARVREWKVPNQTAIPTGTYNLTIDYSPHFQKYMFYILDVPGFDGVRIHSGNTDKDTEGCVLVGTTHTEDEIENSRVALALLWAKLAVPSPLHTPSHPAWEIREPSTVTITNA